MTDFYDLSQRQRTIKWLECYVDGTDGGGHYRHRTLLSAKTEAERLARLTGKKVYLFECVGICQLEASIKWVLPH